MARPNSLDVYYGEETVGTIHDTSPVAFEYAAAWMSRPEPMQIAAIPLQAGRNDSASVQAFFENLLPEGELRDYVAEQRKASTLFSMLLEVAGDTAGGYVIVPSGQRPEAPSYETTSWEALAAILGRKSAAAIDIHGEGARVSLAGAQDKTSIAIFDDGVPMLPRGTSASTHILKPNIKRLAKVWHSAANEAIVMRTAARCGLPTAQVFYETQTESCIVRRFDRISRPDGTLGRVVQYDLCQLVGTVSDRKYEKEGGPGIARCAELIRQYSSQPAVDLRNLVGWLFFNLFVGNNDSHAKNLSIYSVPGKGVTLTPFYDLMCTRLYPGLSPEFAFEIGGESKPGSMTRDHFTAMAKQLGMRPQFVVSQGLELAERLPEAMAMAMEDIHPSLPHAAYLLANRLEMFIKSTTKKLATRIRAQPAG